MKPVILIAWAFSAFYAHNAPAQTHVAVLTWQDSLNPPGATYNIYRESGACFAKSFTQIATGITALTYSDETVTSGEYCYEVVAVYNGQQSAPSNTAKTAVPTFAPTGLSVLTSHVRISELKERIL